ncbi:MAG: peptide ABC transporter substrate-binding protein [Gammaproteobacteria bacterium]|nr:peptide ABC transporter substrate-binding protein [Gammaproteobacteria bacterium]
MRSAWLAAAFLLTACGSHESNVEASQRTGILHFGNGDEPQDLDPHTVTGIPETHILMALFEGLVAKDPTDLGIRPGVAERWTLSEDQKTYTFHLRPDARWSNGEPVTAGDFVWSWRRALQPALGNLYAYMFYSIRGAAAFHAGRIVDFSRVGVRALDERTLEIQLIRPVPYFLQLLDHHSFYPINPRVIERFGATDERGTRWTRPGNFVGNGAFALDEWQLNRLLTLKRNVHYWDAARVRLDGIRFYPISSASTEERMFRAGQLHVIDRVPAEKIAVYRDEDPAALRITPFLGSYFYRFNVTVKPLDDPRVRRALALCIDRKQIVERITRGGQIPAGFLTPPETAGYVPPAGIPYDPETARALMAAAGFPGGSGFPELELQFNTDELHRKIATVIQQMWRRELGVHVALTSQDWKVQQSRESHLQYHISRGSWIGDYVDPTTFLDLFRGDGGNNRTGWNNARYDALLDAAARATDDTRRRALLRQAEQVLLDEAPILPLYIYTQVRLVSPRLCGWHPNLLDQHPYKHLWLAAPGARCP